MIRLGRRSGTPGKLQPLRSSIRCTGGPFRRTPVRFPRVPPGSTLVAGYSALGSEEYLVICDDLTDVRRMFHLYNRGGLEYLQWYVTADSRFYLGVVTT